MASKKKQDEKPVPSLSREGVLQAIRSGILADSLAPGQRLVESDLCAFYGATRSNVRAALTELVHEELVEHIANVGARVKVVTLAEALQITEVRLAVEGICVVKAAERITDQQIEVMFDHAKALKLCAERDDTIGFADLTHQVFELYVGIAEQPVAAETLARLRARNARHRFRLTYRSGRSRVALSYWVELIGAICRREPDQARRALQRLTENVQEGMKAIEHETPSFASPALAKFH